ncbi:MAG: alpha/beta fold hydrolase [Hyphomicrobiales bacterium]|nr:alpha/beta fold hydrolase [Hyphomicrobiales bacterium]
MPVMKVGAVDLEYEDAGSGPPVILVHSSASGLRQWRSLVALLSGRHRVIAVNLFGYGRTSPWPAAQPLTLADEAELVAAAAERAGEPVVLVGHSLGGAVALETAARFPDRVRLLVAFEPILFGHLAAHGPGAAYSEVMDLARRFDVVARAGDWDAAGALFIDYWASSGTWAAMPERRKQITLAMLPPVLHEWAMATAALRPLAGWRAIAAPVHLIGALDSRAPTRAVIALLAQAYPHWPVHEVACGGHMAPLSRPDLVNPLLADIIAGRRV